MDINDLSPGQGVQIDITTNRAKHSFNTSVALIHKNILLLDPIIVNNKLVGFPADCAANLTVTVSDTFFIWKGITIQTVNFKGRSYHAVEMIGEAEAVNRRNNFRVYIGEVMTIVYFTEDGPKTHRTMIKDISEKGFAFITKESFDVGRMVRLNILLANNLVLPMTAKIVRTCPTEKAGEFLFGCQFSEKNPRLSNWLMQLQRDKQKKKNGLIHKTVR